MSTRRLGWLPTADRLSPWQQSSVVAAANPEVPSPATLLEQLDATVLLGTGSSALLPADVDLVVTSPG